MAPNALKKARREKQPAGVISILLRQGKSDATCPVLGQYHLFLKTRSINCQWFQNVDYFIRSQGNSVLRGMRSAELNAGQS